MLTAINQVVMIIGATSDIIDRYNSNQSVSRFDWLASDDNLCDNIVWLAPCWFQFHEVVSYFLPARNYIMPSDLKVCHCYASFWPWRQILTLDKFRMASSPNLFCERRSTLRLQCFKQWHGYPTPCVIGRGNSWHRECLLPSTLRSSSHRKTS